LSLGSVTELGKRAAEAFKLAVSILDGNGRLFAEVFRTPVVDSEAAILTTS
jgi:hypothetical protein